MSSSSMLRRRIGWGASSLMAAVAMVGWGTAAASVPQSYVALQVPAPAGGFVVGTSTEVHASVLGTGMPFLPNMQVTFTDNGTCFDSMYPLNVDESDVRATWTPTTPGIHTLTVTQGGGSATQTVTVAAAPAGTKVPTPSTPGCGGSGSAGSGSFGS
ncbi:hypothetical protein GPX89_07385 [Nocardia sp. ET3-3]|uniref:Ig-like domain repeat protein n=1 Tax=Nocardia terrae TaxID=2675851 RepID=A0A7K1USC9_9NOCA|nr:hypothetical protein [Nocardia terrae]MVU77069.1 hypothetical protein [Nocardia terrae]